MYTELRGEAFVSPSFDSWQQSLSSKKKRSKTKTKSGGGTSEKVAKRLCDNVMLVLHLEQLFDLLNSILHPLLQLRKNGRKKSAR